MVCQLRKMNSKVNINWQNLQNTESKKYTCGYCGNAVASAQGWLSKMHNPDTGQSGNGPTIYICHHCDRPTFFDIGESQYPGAPFGSPIAHITSTEVAELYTESIDCMRVNAYTASAICSRKILMYIAVNNSSCSLLYGCHRGVNSLYRYNLPRNPRPFCSASKIHIWRFLDAGNTLGSCHS